MLRILVVDDEENLRNLYRNELEDAGYEVLAVGNGAEAVAALRSFTPDLAILDIKLDQENGLEALRRMKHMRPELRVVLNSGYSTYKDDFSSWLADAYLVKSSDTCVLLATVRELLETRPVV